MKKRSNFIKIYLILYCIFSLFLYFGLRSYTQKNFNPDTLSQLIHTKSQFKDITDNPCKHQLLGEPDVGKEYFKINFWCQDLSSARSTLSFRAFPKKDLKSILYEYSNLVGLNYDLFTQQKWYCTLNDQEIKLSDWPKVEAPLASTINCYQSKNLKNK